MTTDSTIQILLPSDKAIDALMNDLKEVMPDIYMLNNGPEVEERSLPPVHFWWEMN